MIQSNTIWTSTEVLFVLNTKGCSEWSTQKVSIDSRFVKEGDLFLSLSDDCSRHYNCAVEALKKGACAVIVSQHIEEIDISKQIIVTDTFEALISLAKHARDRSQAKIFAVSGSTDAIETKEILSSILNNVGQVHKSSTFNNNKFDVLISLVNMHPGTDLGVFNINFDNEKDVKFVSSLLKPKVTIITNTSLNKYKMQEGIRGVIDVQSAIFKAMQKNDIVILNYDDNSFSQMKNKAEEESLRVVSFGTKNGSDFKMLSCLEAANGSRVEGNLFQQKVYFSLQIPSYKIAYNSLAAILAGFVSGFDIHKLTNTISKIDTLGDDDSKEIIPLDNFQNPITLINESSSASPESMNAAFKVLALIDPGRGGRRIAVLGDMLECGQDTNKSHEDLALPLKAANVDLVYTCGTKMKNLYKNLPANQRGKHSLDSKELAQIVPEVLIPGDVVLVKGALGSKMNTVVEALRKLPEKFKKATQN